MRQINRFGEILGLNKARYQILQINKLTQTSIRYKFKENKRQIVAYQYSTIHSFLHK